MLTGDENIVDVDFSVLWKVKPTGVGEYLFNIQNPEGTVKAVAESAMREVIGRSEIQPILTGARQTIETAVQDLMQKTLDNYGAGILVQQVQLQKVDPPTQVIDAFRDVQAARADLERSVNEAQTYANRVIPEARGNVAKITPGGGSLSLADRGGSHRPDLALPQDLRAVQEGARRSRASACISKRWSACSATPTRSSSIPRRRQPAWCPICRSRAVSCAEPPAPAAPAPAAVGRPP